MKSNEYQCSLCGGIFPKGWTDEEALKEKNQIFPSIPIKECVVICDTCFNEMNKAGYIPNPNKVP